MTIKFETVDAYIAQFPSEVKELLTIVRQTVSNVAPQALEVISYGMPTYKLKGNLVHFAAYKNHIGFYPGPNALIKFAHEIKHYKHSKGAVQFPLDQDLPLALIKKITRFCVNEQENN